MNKLQENKLSMYILVAEECKKFETEWNNMKIFADAVSGFDAVIENIVGQRQIQESKTTGTTTKRKKMKANLVYIADQIASTLKVYAQIQNDDELYASIDYSKRDLVASRDTILRDKCLLIYNAAASVKKHLIDYGIELEILTEFKHVLRTYEASFAKTKQAMNTRRMATSTLRELFHKGDHILKNHLDHLIKLYKIKNPEFFSTYKNARKIIDRGIRHKTVAITKINQAA